MNPDKNFDMLTEMESDATSDPSKLDTLNSQNLRSMAEVAREIRDKEADPQSQKRGPSETVRGGTPFYDGRDWRQFI